MDSKPFAQLLKFLLAFLIGLIGPVVLAAAALLLSGCRSGRDVATAGPGATVEPTSTLSPASSCTKPEANSSQLTTDNSLHNEPEPARRLFGLLPPKRAATGPIHIKNKGTLIIQSGTGNTAAGATKPAGPQSTAGHDALATDNTKAGSRGGAAATGDGSQATAVTSKAAGIPWWVWALVFSLGGAAGWWVRGKASVLSWWPAKLRPG